MNVSAKFALLISSFVLLLVLFDQLIYNDPIHGPDGSQHYNV